MFHPNSASTTAAFAVIWVLASFPGSACADSPPINLGYFNKLAMNGYDVMSYWQGGKPLEGKRAISYKYKDAVWVFVSKENRDTFAADPERFAPRYGGYCAYAAAHGQFSDVDPFAWQIYKGKLYLNYGPRVQRSWGSNIDDFISRADTVWPKMTGRAVN